MTPSATPRYRYREEAPEAVSVQAAELLASLPGELRGEGVPEGRVIDLPCAGILRRNTPGITLGLLRELAPDLIRVPEGRDPSERILLPPGWIALHFRMVTRREELAPEMTPKTAEPAVESSGEAEGAPLVVESKPHPSPVPEKPHVPEPREVVTVPVVETPAAQPAAPKQEEPVPEKKGFFSSLPIFRRTEPAAARSVPGNATENTGKELAVPVLERLWKLDPKDELADTAALQALFMTDEKLTLEKVLSKAGELPGLDACVLAHGDQVICASKPASGIDLRNLSGQAMTMLSQIRESSAKMGLGSVPAVTLHADQGVLSFLHKGELCLLVLHADRGFVPGVRERLQEMLGHLSEARPALPPAAGS